MLTWMVLVLTLPTARHDQQEDEHGTERQGRTNKPRQAPRHTGPARQHQQAKTSRLSFSFSFSSRWHRSARKGPYALRPVCLPNVVFETVAMTSTKTDRPCKARQALTKTRKTTTQTAPTMQKKTSEERQTERLAYQDKHRDRINKTNAETE